MTNVNIKKFVDDLRAELMSEVQAVRQATGSIDDTDVATAFNYAALTVTTRLLGDSDPRQISPPLTKKEGLTRGEKAWRTRKKNAAKKANRENSVRIEDRGEDEGDNLRDEA